VQVPWFRMGGRLPDIVTPTTVETRRGDDITPIATAIDAATNGGLYSV